MKQTQEIVIGNELQMEVRAYKMFDVMLSFH